MYVTSLDTITRRCFPSIYNTEISKRLQRCITANSSTLAENTILNATVFRQDIIRISSIQLQSPYQLQTVSQFYLEEVLHQIFSVEIPWHVSLQKNTILKDYTVDPCTMQWLGMLSLLHTVENLHLTFNSTKT